MRLGGPFIVLGAFTLALLASAATAQPFDKRTFEFYGRYDWRIHDFDRPGIEEDPHATAESTLEFRGRLRLTHLQDTRVLVTWEADRITYKRGRRTWTVEAFDDREQLIEQFQRSIVRCRPIFRLPQAAAYETESLGRLLALLDRQTVRMDLSRRPFERDPLKDQIDTMLLEWAPPWPRDEDYAGHWGTIWRRYTKEDDGYRRRLTRYLPHHSRLRGLLWNQLKHMAFFVAQPGYTHKRSHQLLADERGRFPGASVGRWLKKYEPESPLPAYSILGVYGWLPVHETAIVGKRANFKALPDRELSDASPQGRGRLFEPYYELEDVSSRNRDAKQISHHRRGKRSLPQPVDSPEAIVAAQRLREAEARLRVIDRFDRDPLHEEDGTAEYLKRIGRPELWMIAERGINHQVKTNVPRNKQNLPSGRQLITQTQVKSSPAVRLLDEVSGDTITAGRRISQSPLQSLRHRIRLKATTRFEAKALE